MQDEAPPPPTEYLFPADLAWDLKSPCNDCPFRRDAPDHEGVAANLVKYMDAIDAGRFAHTCHKTDNRQSCDGPRNYQGPVQHCAGALTFLIKSKNDLQLPIIMAIDAGKLDISAAASRAKKNRSVFSSVGELLRYYLAVSQRILGRDKP